MKILDITTVRTGSTGRNSTDLQSYHQQQGDVYRIAYSVPDSRPQGDDIIIGSKLDHKIHAFLSRVFGLQGYFSNTATKKFLRRVKEFGPDVVVMGNLHANFINLPLLFDFLAEERIPTVNILHDCWFFTGGKCTHFTKRGCYKWKSHCRNCPARGADIPSWFFDFSYKMFEDRRRWYNRLKSFTLVAVSDWEKNLALQSPLLEKAKVIRVYNWVNTEIFKPATPEMIHVIKKKYKLSPDVKYVVSVSAGWSPDSSKTSDAIRLAEILPKEYKLIVVGRADAGIFPNNIVYIPHTSDQLELAVLYSLSSAYLHFSVEDTFGKVIAEAMSSGTVPIVFDSTACGEVAGPFGIKVTPHDVHAMVSSLSLLEDKARKEAVRQYALENYNAAINKEIYREKIFLPLLEANKNRNV